MSAITVIIILICALIDITNAYSILFTVKTDLITIILSVASIVINHLSNTLCGYAIAGDEVRFVSGTHCTSSTTQNFIFYDDRGGGRRTLKFRDNINIVSVLALVDVEFLAFNVSSCVVLVLCVFCFVLFLCLFFCFATCACVCVCSSFC